MSEDPNRKSLRQFQARDYLWSTFEQMSQELDCSVDYLVNEAMKHYARAQGRIQGPASTAGAARPMAPMPAGMNPMQRATGAMPAPRPGMPAPRPGMPGPNVSRQHARVVRHQGQYWMVDMGSTNGIEFQGQRVDRRPIGEGDVFRICDHDVVFTYR